MTNPNIRPATRSGEVVKIDNNSEMIFCTEKGAMHYMRGRGKAAANSAFSLHTITGIAKKD